MHLVGALADRSRWSALRCPAAATLDVVGSRSAVLIMREALYGTTRFDDFAQRVGLTDGVVSGRLRELTDLGLLARVPYQEPGRRTRFEYRLTERGADFGTVVLALFEWGAKHLAPGGRAPFDLEHGGDGESGGDDETCGAAVHAKVMCEAGHEVAPHAITVRRRAQPVASSRRSASSRATRTSSR